MILGTSAYKNVIRAATFRPEVDVGLGYLARAAKAPPAVSAAAAAAATANSSAHA